MFSLNRIRMNSKMMRKKIGFIKLIQLWGIVFLTALASVIVGIDLVTTYYYSNIRMNALRTDHVEQQKQMSKREVERVVGMMNYDRMQNDALKGTKSYVNVEKLQAEWMERINNIRFGKNLVGYLFVDDWKGKSLAHGAQPDLINTEMWEYEDSRGNKTTQLLIAASKKKDGGFAEFWWRKPDTGEESPKIVYSKGIPEWELFVGSGVYVDDIEQNIAILQEVLDKQTKTKIFISLIIVVIAFALFLIVFNLLSNRLRKDLNLFISFFDQAAFSDKKIDRETVQFVEFDQMAEYANKMLQDKMKVEIEREQAVEKVQELLTETTLSRDLLGSVINSTPDWIYAKDRDFRYILVNEGYASAMEKTPEDFIGKDDIEIGFPKELIFGNLDKDIVGFRNDDKKVLNGEKVHNPYDPATLADGVLHIFDTHKMPLTDRGGNVYAALGFSRDTTERKWAEDELASSEEFLNNVIEQSPVSLWISDSEGTLIKMNQSCRELLGSTDEEAVGNYNLFKDNLIEEQGFMPLIENVFEKGEIARFTIDYDLPRVDHVKVNGATHRILDVVVSPIKDMHGKVTNAIVQHRDITELKRAEEALNEYAERLEQMVEERTKDLESFAYSISHDLRAPLRHMSGFTKMFMNHAGEGLDDEGRRYLDVVTTSAELMGVLIDDLLKFSRTGRAELRMSQVDMGPLVKEAINQLQPEIEGRNIEWKIGALPEIRADRAMMLLVLVNLISNAIKFTSPREKALIEIGTGGDGEDETVFFVHDNGVGFDMKYVDKLFGVFQRLHRKEDFEGTGIGLANVRRIISRHNGRSWAEAEVDKGATIWFSLPK